MKILNKLKLVIALCGSVPINSTGFVSCYRVGCILTNPEQVESGQSSVYPKVAIPNPSVILIKLSGEKIFRDDGSAWTVEDLVRAHIDKDTDPEGWKFWPLLYQDPDFEKFQRLSPHQGNGLREAPEERMSRQAERQRFLEGKQVHNLFNLGDGLYNLHDTSDEKRHLVTKEYLEDLTRRQQFGQDDVLCMTAVCRFLAPLDTWFDKWHADYEYHWKAMAHIFRPRGLSLENVVILGEDANTNWAAQEQINNLIRNSIAQCLIVRKGEHIMGFGFCTNRSNGDTRFAVRGPIKSRATYLIPREIEKQLAQQIKSILRGFPKGVQYVNPDLDEFVNSAAPLTQKTGILSRWINKFAPDEVEPL